MNTDQITTDKDMCSKLQFEKHIETTHLNCRNIFFFPIFIWKKGSEKKNSTKNRIKKKCKEILIFSWHGLNLLGSVYIGARTIGKSRSFSVR